MEIKTATRYYLIYVRMSVIKKISIGKNVENKESLYTIGGYVNWYIYYEKHNGVPQKIKNSSIIYFEIILHMVWGQNDDLLFPICISSCSRNNFRKDIISPIELPKHVSQKSIASMYANLLLDSVLESIYLSMQTLPRLDYIDL